MTAFPSRKAKSVTEFDNLKTRLGATLAAIGSPNPKGATP